MTEALVIAKKLTRRFGSAGRSTVEALQDASFEIHPRARIALFGPSGSGKSTLLHLIAGLDSPTTGSIDWPGLGSIDELRPRRIGFVFQSPSLFPPLTGAQNVALPMMLADETGQAEGRATSLLNEFGLADLADKLPEEMSGGQAQRVAMVRALAVAPKLVLADEPTGQLDGVTAQAFFDEVLTQLESIDAALVVATHDPSIANRMTCRWIMVHGRLFTGREGGSV